jgi:hypothetical protein
VRSCDGGQGLDVQEVAGDGGMSGVCRGGGIQLRVSWNTSLWDARVRRNDAS